jgi:enolase
MDENGWDGWKFNREELVIKVQLVGDDLFVDKCGTYQQD